MDIPSTTLAVIEWGDGSSQVGTETPYEGETQTPSGIIWVQDTDELVIVDRVNERLVVTDAVGTPLRTIALPVEGWLTDGVMLPDRRLLVAEVRRRDGQVVTVAHIVDVASGAVESTEAVAIPIAPDTTSLRFDPSSGLVYAAFGKLYPYYDTRSDSIVVTDIAVNSWAGLVTDDAQAGITSGPDYLAATFPLQPTIIDVEATSTDVWAMVVAVDWDLANEDGVDPPVYQWLTRYPFDGSPITAIPTPVLHMWSADNVFAVREHDIVLMVASDAGLELHTFPTSN
jgi:hypothetical protein